MAHGSGPSNPHLLCTVSVIDHKDFEHKDEDGILWKLCRIGSTKSDHPKEHPAPTEVEEMNKSLGPDSASVVFFLSDPAGKKKEIMQKMGYPVPETKDKGFPAYTDWVITTDTFIQVIRHKIKRKKTKTTRELFHNLAFPSNEDPQPSKLTIPHWPPKPKPEDVVKDQGTPNHVAVPPDMNTQQAPACQRDTPRGQEQQQMVEQPEALNTNHLSSQSQQARPSHQTGGHHSGSLHCSNTPSASSTVAHNYLPRKLGPHIFCFVINREDFTHSDNEGQLWKFCRIGFSKKDWYEHQVRPVQTKVKEINDKFLGPNSASEVFSLSHSSTSNSVDKTEIKQKMGYEIKEKAKALGFPKFSDWVITTDSFIKTVKDTIESKGTKATTAVFKKLAFQHNTYPLPADLTIPNWPKSRDGAGQTEDVDRQFATMNINEDQGTTN